MCLSLKEKARLRRAGESPWVSERLRLAQADAAGLLGDHRRRGRRHTHVVRVEVLVGRHVLDLGHRGRLVDLAQPVSAQHIEGRLQLIGHVGRRREGGRRRRHRRHGRQREVGGLGHSRHCRERSQSKRCSTVHRFHGIKLLDFSKSCFFVTSTRHFGEQELYCSMESVIRQMSIFYKPYFSTFIRIPSFSISNSIFPLSIVLMTSLPIALTLSMVSLFGCPYLLSLPAEIIA